VSLAADVDDFDYQAILPEKFDLKQNHPNPFNPSTRIDFDVREGGHVELSVFNILGQKVETLIDKQLPLGSYSLDWSATSSDGRPLPSGTYFYRIRTDDISVTRKMVLLR